ncbi:MAG: GtrA family protein [Betaproteobacteria bacterium]|nr:GtrA family protein [Betaproteobacteria bacterium]
MTINTEAPGYARERRHHAAGEFVRYFVVSLVALGVEMLFLLFLAQWMHYTLAASLSFMIGAGVHYLLSVAFVFRKRRLLSRRYAEAAIFVGTGIAALLVNVAVIAICIELLGTSLPLAKLGAAGFSFLFGYVVRKMALF